MESYAVGHDFGGDEHLARVRPAELDDERQGQGLWQKIEREREREQRE